MLSQTNSIRGACFLLAIALLFSGCSPPGPRALLKGKKFLDRGDVADAVTQFKRATTLLSTNANAWNYYGVALQHAGQPDEAAAAYETALRLDRDLVEAHFNLGSLFLEQNKPEQAKAEFTTYTLRRPNESAGWFKLGLAQLRAGDDLQAERSFSAVHALKDDDADAFNGLGLARVQEGKPRQAAEFFTAALQARPNFAPALLNLATVNDEYLHDSRSALASYQAYVSLAPRPAYYDEVRSIIANLAQSEAAASVVAPLVVPRTSPPPEPKPKTTIAAVVTRPAPVYHKEAPEPVETQPIHATPRPNPTPAPSPSPPVTPIPTENVRVAPEPAIVATPRTNTEPYNAATRPTVLAARTPPTNAVARPEPLEVPMPDDETKPGFWHKLFGNNNGNADNPSSAPTPAKRYHEDAVTPIPEPPEEIAGTKAGNEKPLEPRPVSPPVMPRYAYTSPQKPAPGDRRSAEGAFTKARMAEQDEDWLDALQWYQIAADTDPSWFEAQYNTGVIAHRMHNYSVALPRYELALAIQPESIDARYNFALALKASGYPADAADELRKILVISPDEVRAHLALANLCAQSLHDTAQAREHYLKVLELQPDNPQASDIRFWLSANAK